jgi:SAM-dependent methyltransferase
MDDWHEHWRDVHREGDDSLDDYPGQGPQVEAIALALKLSGELYRRTVLDAGSGTGRSALTAASMGASVYAFDFVEDRVSESAAAFDAKRLDIEWSVGDLRAPATWPQEPETFDVVQCIEAAQYAEPARLIPALWARVAPGGRLLFTLPSADHPGARRQPGGQIACVTPRWVGTIARGLEGCGPWKALALHYGIDQSLEVYDSTLMDEFVSPAPVRVLACFRRGIA